MALSDEKIKGYVQRLLLSRMRILCNHGFYGLLLMHMKYAVDEETETAYTDAERIVFGTEFLENLSDGELDFVMMHEILHVVLQHCFRGNELKDQEGFNVACDIVVNSNLMLESDIKPGTFMLSKYGEPMHIAPDGKEGHEFTAEQVYEMFLNSSKKKKGNGAFAPTADKRKGSGASDGDKDKKKGGADITVSGLWDDHSKWNEGDGDKDASLLRDEWSKRVIDAARTIEIRDASNGRTDMPMIAKRLLKELTEPKIDWRAILNDFVQEEVVDYSFTPPDKRYDGGDFFLPDFNEKDEKVDDVLFMVDTSGSMSDKMVTEAFSEIRGAIDQFGGRLCGRLGFFDAVVVEPVPFSSVEEFEIIRPKGGGGTDFKVIFDYVREKMETPPVSIVILTDGYAPVPDERDAMGIPVLWLINNEDVTPKWGRIARLPSD